MDMNDIINRHAKAARRVAVPAKTQIDPVIIEMMAKAADRHFDAIMAHKHAGIPAWEDASAEYRGNAIAAMGAALNALLASGYQIVRRAA